MPALGHRSRAILVLVPAALWLAAHLVTLTRYPPMHADEAWLASGTRSILVSRSAAATEEFFRITPRSPHAIRLLFHALQAPFVAASFTLASVRLLSLACGVGVVLLAAAMARTLFASSAARVSFVAFLALDPGLFVSAHLARSEIVLVLAFMAALALRERRRARGVGCDATAGLILGLAVGLHPNSLIVALAVGGVWLGDVLRGPDRARALGRLGVLVGVTSALAFGWAAWSRSLSPSFPAALGEFGDRYGVGESLAVKLLRLPMFYGRLADRVMGTYYVPDLRLSLLLFAVAAAASLARLVYASVTRRPTDPAPLLALCGVNLGLVLIGKYSQPTAVLIAPAGWWLVAALVDALCLRLGAPARRAAAAPVVILGALLALGSALSARPWMGVSYSRYVKQVREAAGEAHSVLAGPNTAFAFAPGVLRAWNDLAFLPEAGLRFADYVEREGIQVILFPEALETIYAERPLWNDIYGNVAPYWSDLKAFLAERCTLVTVLDEPVFALRILPYQARSRARLFVYRVD